MSRRARAARRRRASARLRDLLIGDPLRKLAALGLAIGLWAYLDAELSRTEEFLLDLRVANRSDLSGQLDPDRLVVGVDLQRYSLVDFSDAETGEPIREVLMECRGPNARVDALANRSGFLAQPLLTEADGQVIAELGVADVRAPEPWFDGLNRTMRPARIRVTLSPTRKERLLLTTDRVRFVPPPGAARLGERLLMEHARFTPEDAVTLRGPDSLIRELLTAQRPLFRFAPQPPDENATESSALLTLDLDDPRISYEGELPQLTVPLRSAAVEFTLVGIPVLLHEPAVLRGRFRTVRDREDVRIDAFGRLVGRLRSMADQPRVLRRWIDENCLIVASIPLDASGPDIAPRPRVLIGPDFRDGKDYKLTLPLTIQYEPRN